MTLRFFNTLKRKLQVFKPIKEGFVGLYTCGPTVYNYPHIGNYRAYIFEDILRRYLEYKGFHVNQIMNITDVDDKTIRDSQKEGSSLKQFTERYTQAFFEDLKSLNIQPAAVYPLATDHIKEMIEIIDALLKKKKAYKTDDGCAYYEISKFKKYGQLANMDVSQLQAGASGRVQHDEYDRDHPQDFALWKAWTPEDGDVKWDSPWGAGRPGWHIECSAMSRKYLGDQFDMHTGGVDNIFPHHQNEIAQTEGFTGKTFVKYWLHCEHLLVDGQKMSKSLGNFYTLRDILNKGHHPLAVRYLLLSAHYRQKLNFTMESLGAARAALDRIWECVRKLEAHKEGAENPAVDKLLARAQKNFERSMDNDLESAPALAAMFDMITKVNSWMMTQKIGPLNAQAVLTVMKKFDKVLGVLVEEEKIPEHIQKLVQEREQARTSKQFDVADKLREKLKQAGYVVDDTPQGPVVKKAA
ncbi:cysteine--tRNA ligase [Candidatus Woesearchaeota archaeon]|nr:cysteine--tRNA ligase [Candidatus Woesearchaeota archaeon]